MAISSSVKVLRFNSTADFRQKIVLSTIANTHIRVDNIRHNDENPGLRDFEVSFLRLIEKLTNGSSIEISYSGTSLLYKPGVLIGGKLFHDCPVSRGIGYFLEPVIALAPFCKIPLMLSLTGITNDNIDISVDSLRTVTLPILKNFGITEGVELKISKRGAIPLGGGEVFFRCPIVRALKTCQLLEAGQISRIRGIAYCTRISPQIANRVANSARSILTKYIPDVYVYTDVYKGAESGLSPGYACNLVAESNTGTLLSAECAYQPRKAVIEKAVETAYSRGLFIKNEEKNLERAADLDTMDVDDPVVRIKLNESISSQMEVQEALKNDYLFPTPEDLGIRVARMLLMEIKKGGCYDTTNQWLPILFLALGPMDVGKIRLGGISQRSVEWLRDLRRFLGVTFKISVEEESKTVMLTAVGIGYENVSKRAG
ncbi:rRNA-processing endoribonuclease [Nowakowskiella sp. JEL0078]|nr:rRNA-processing endoribonuclease [Nowakowskiella sp. JEL0078]